MNRVTAIISALVICIVVCLSWAVNHYRDNAITYKEQRDKATYIIAGRGAALAGRVFDDKVFARGLVRPGADGALPHLQETAVKAGSSSV